VNPPPDADVAYLRSTRAIRERCGLLLARIERGESRWFRLRSERLGACADLVAAVTRRDYTDLDVPVHSRWRHFEAGGVDRAARLAERLRGDAREQARARIDLAVVSVLLDAGAGDAWRYRSEGREYTRSEGLAVATFEMFERGLFSSDARVPLRADSEALLRLDLAGLGAALQVRPDNPLVGLPGRLELLHNLGRAVASQPEFFGGRDRRLGNLLDALIFDALLGAPAARTVPAERVLQTLLAAFASIWPGRHAIAGENLGDTWRHAALDHEPVASGFVPFHKLSQWLAYSLIEPLEASGCAVTGVDALTGLAEYRNGGLVVDAGVLVPLDDRVRAQAHRLDAEIVVEWRAATVVLLDRLAEAVRQRLGLDAGAFPLAKVLQGGTWTAGRELARQARPDGSPPIRVQSDGTVF
jgi:hypothetical protein